MKRFITASLIGVLTVLLSLGTPRSADANLLPNGSFEEGRYGEAYPFAASSWAGTIGGTPDTGWSRVLATDYGIPSPDGAYVLGIRTPGDSTYGIYNEAEHRAGGYAVSLSVRRLIDIPASGGTPETLWLGYYENANGNAPKPYLLHRLEITDTEWQTVTLHDFVTASRPWNLYLVARGSGNLLFVDNVSITPNPEPAGIVTLAIGLSGLALLTRKKREGRV